MDKYKQNLRVDNDKVYSYNTLVAEIDGDILWRLGHWSMTTSKHINYVAREYELIVKDKPADHKAADPKSSMLKTTSMVAMMGSLLCDKEKDKNKFKKRILNTLPGASFPEDFDNLPEAEKTKRLNGAIECIS